ncbi:MAG: DNA mismatch repair endonuclease MutL [Spirochaetales bacterium]|nr:DNA mismatch repair endonuclease MutL [Spirochaetales bacterium]
MASIRQLDPIVASRIAAGEVVERPSSVLRELLDNAIDANATKITVYVEDGGIKNLTVIDNGSGMSADDLELACSSHATSKVRTLEDLFNLKTLGFRGEALSSIAACSRLTINSNGNRITVDNGIQGKVVPGSIESGTSVTMEGLFDNIPARKLFLKRPQSELAECRKTFIEKALGFEDIEFILIADGELKCHFEKTDKTGRAIQVMSLDRSFAGAQPIKMSYEGDNLSLFAVSSDPATYKRDRTQIKILVNNRIIDSFQFVQAITNAYSAALPGGAFPFFYLFIDDNPSLVDFNIHPTKRECKLRNQSQIYGAITSMIRKALISKTYDTDERTVPQTLQFEPESPAPSPAHEAQTPKPYAEQTGEPRPSYGQSRRTTEAKPFDPSWFENAKAILERGKTQTEPLRPAVEVSTTKVIPEYRYVGQVFDTFLMVELDEKLMFIDQHALHERILFDEIKALKDVQRLIVPYQFEVERSVDDYLQENSVLYSDFGIELTRKEPLLWEMASMPAACRKNEDKIVSFIQTQTGDIETMQKDLFAIIACHSAIKAGDRLDPVTANELVRKCFRLDRMVCPHGRDFTFSISKEELYRQVGRLV